MRDERALDPLRLAEGVEAARCDDGWWVRGPVPASATEKLQRALPAEARFEWLEGDRLRLPGARVPCGRLPVEAVWTLLPELIPLALPSASPSARLDRKPTLRLVRGGAETAPDGLLLGLEAWSRWAVEAPAVRLQPLRFAVTAGEGASGARALVLGQPLPPLPGQRLVSRAGIVVPAGWTWYPAVDASVVRRTLRLRADEIALWSGEDAMVAIIPAEAVVPASRSAVRLTLSRLAATPSPPGP